MDSKIIAFAIESHAKVNQTYDGKPYSVHLIMAFIQGMRFIHIIPEERREDVLNALWLHDTVEDCRLTYNDILKMTNKKVADLVYAVTNEKGRNRKQRANSKYYKGIREEQDAIFIKMSDRLANVKYSRDKLPNSRMFNVYKEENDDFLKHLFINKEQEIEYKEMIEALKDSFIFCKSIPQPAD